MSTGNNSPPCPNFQPNPPAPQCNCCQDRTDALLAGINKLSEKTDGLVDVLNKIRTEISMGPMRTANAMAGPRDTILYPPGISLGRWAEGHGLPSGKQIVSIMSDKHLEDALLALGFEDKDIPEKHMERLTLFHNYIGLRP